MTSPFNYNIFFRNFPEMIINERITLRELNINDAENYFNILTTPQVHQYLSDDDVPRSLESAKKEILYWKNLFTYKRSICWAISDSNKELIGSVGFNTWSIYNQRAEINYDLSYSHWRQGIMTSTLEKVIEFAFSKMSLNRIEARVLLGNKSSISLLEKLGFHKEGVLKKYRVINSQAVDVCLYAKIKD